MGSEAVWGEGISHEVIMTLLEYVNLGLCMKEMVARSTFGDRLQVAWLMLPQAWQSHRNNKREELQVRASLEEGCDSWAWCGIEDSILEQKQYFAGEMVNKLDFYLRREGEKLKLRQDGIIGRKDRWTNGQTDRRKKGWLFSYWIICLCRSPFSFLFPV